MENIRNRCGCGRIGDKVQVGNPFCTGPDCSDAPLTHPLCKPRHINRRGVARARSAAVGTCTITAPSRRTSVQSRSRSDRRKLICGICGWPGSTRDRTTSCAASNVSTRSGLDADAAHGRDGRDRAGGLCIPRLSARSIGALIRPSRWNRPSASTGISGHPGGGFRSRDRPRRLPGIGRRPARKGIPNRPARESENKAIRIRCA